MRSLRTTTLLLLAACSPQLASPTIGHSPEERITVLDFQPGVTATLVAPARLDPSRPIDLIVYALPNGNTTAETMGRRMGEGVGWRFDIQHIGAQTRALRARGVDQAVVAYLEANTRSWPEWRRVHGYDWANARIATIVGQLRQQFTRPERVRVTLTGHSGGGSFTWGFLDAHEAIPGWVDRIAFLDSNYSFEYRHADPIAAWLRADRAHALVVLAYDDREIMLDGKKVVSDSGGTWRATRRMVVALQGSTRLDEDTIGEFVRHRGAQVEVLVHPNPQNRILHTEMIGEMNGYLHALLVFRPPYAEDSYVLRPGRVYGEWVQEPVVLPAPRPPAIPARAHDALTGSAFVRSIAGLTREQREAAILRELMAGNIPSFLRTLRTVRATAPGLTAVATFEVMPDYLAIGSDADFVRMPMTPYTAQAFCDAFGFVLPTRKLVDDTWAAAELHLEPRPMTQERESPLTFLEHHRIIETQLEGRPRGGFVAGIKKDVVIANRLLERPNRVAIYGWHYPDGKPIQPLYPGHVDWYVDYSHGIRPVRRAMQVDGEARTFEDIAGDPALHALVSDEGPLTSFRYRPGT